MHTVYVTKEQAQRLAALACDALVGIQFDADDGDQTLIFGSYVSIDDPSRLECFEVDADGTYRRTT